MYCSALLPSDIANRERALPENLDELVSKALAGGGRVAVQRVREAMLQAPASPATSLPAAPSPASLPADAPVAARPTPTPIVAGPSAAAVPPPGLDHLADLLAEARVALKRDRHADAIAHLQSLAVAARDLARALDPGDGAPSLQPPPEAVLPAEALLPLDLPPPTVQLPPVRKRCVLVVEGLADGERGGELAGPLGIDAATARQIALARYARVALRADTSERLEERAAQLRHLGIRARVVERADLEAMPGARLLLSLAEPGGGPARSPWIVTEQPHWQHEHPPDAAVLYEGAFEAPPARIVLAVPGEVVLVRHVAARDLGRTTHRRHSGERTVAEHRVPVLDLHGPGVHLRLAPGWTSPAGWPGEHAASAALAFRTLVEALPQVFPGVHCEGVRVCNPPRERPVQAEDAGRDRQVSTLSGWPAFEEHSRLCRLLLAPGLD